MRRLAAPTKAALVGAIVALLPILAVVLPGRAAWGAELRGELEHMVILLQPSQAEVDELTREALARITGELTAARFRVVVFPLEAGSDPIEQVDSVGGDLAPVAAFALVRAPDGYGGATELWISDRIAHRTTIQRMRIQGADLSRAAEVLAVESVELIRISLAALWPRPVAPPPAPPVVTVEPVLPPPRAELSLAIGVALMRDLGSSPGVWSPIASAAYRWPGGLGMFLAARGFGSEVELATIDGSARIQRQAAWLGVLETFRVGRRFQPVLSVAAGADRLRAQGTAEKPMYAHSVTSWSALLAAGGGLAATVAPHLAVVLDLQGMLFLPPVAVLVGQTETSLARPSLLVDVGLRASF